MKSKKGHSTIRRINDWLHLWLGLASGIIVFIVSLTGCIYVFQQDIKDVLEPWRFVEARNQQYVPPGVLLDTAVHYVPGVKPTGLTYSTREGAAAIGFSSRENGTRSFTVVFMNPYTGEFLNKQQTIGGSEFDFFRFIIDGHRALWLPYKIGRPIVGVATIIFVILLITGLVMWWPKNWKKSSVDKSFKIKWRAKFKRVNYDLHNVLGFYSLLLALVIAITGLVWSFEWFSNGLYYATSGGKTKPAHEEHPHSDTTKIKSPAGDSTAVFDLAWYDMMAQEPDVQGIYLTPTFAGKDDPIEIIAYQDAGSWYDRHTYFYDRYTLQRLPSHENSFSEAAFADQLSMLNYDIHIGAVWGLPGKILAFLISLICASLPVTGFLVWLNKQKKDTRERHIKKRKDSARVESDTMQTVP